MYGVINEIYICEADPWADVCIVLSTGSSASKMARKKTFFCAICVFGL
jgi:hypothetical protein